MLGHNFNKVLPLFNKLTSPDPQVRKHPLLVGPRHRDSVIFRSGRQEGIFVFPPSNESFMFTARYPLPVHSRMPGFRAGAPLWLRALETSFPAVLSRTATRFGFFNIDTGKSFNLRYIFSRWTPYGVSRPQLPFLFPPSGARLLRSPDRQPGLLDALGRGARIRELGLSEALNYGYLLDTRFILLMCLSLGFSIWCFTVPGPLLQAPDIITAPDLGEVVRVARDTYVHNVCSVHHSPSPCHCGEPLNKALPIYLKLFDAPFDPLNLDVKYRALGVATFVGAVILSLALSESVCEHGFSVV